MENKITKKELFKENSSFFVKKPKIIKFSIKKCKKTHTKQYLTKIYDIISRGDSDVKTNIQ